MSAPVRSTVGLLQPLLVADLTYPLGVQRWPPAFPPASASAWGDDQYGLWIDVKISGPVQRFRWVEPGEFVMGSPESEMGRLEHEGPRHVVRLTEGFWLADTACSQALWSAVMGANPSEFQDTSQNPVEQVSWDNVINFLVRVERLLPGLQANLPTEAEWEYACRVGVERVFGLGDEIGPEQANYDSSISYAGGPSSQWRKKTVPVKSFMPNAWGLYQMHGNVWEWCADGPRIYDCTSKVNPRGETRADEPQRVIRGGAWSVAPRLLRSSCRNHWHRDWRSDRLGFRFLVRSISSCEEYPPV